MIARYRNKEIYFRTRGAGVPLLLLHGFLESSRMWEELAGKWQQGHLVITMDLPGHGQSAVLDNVHTMTEMARAAAAVLDELHISSCRVVGHSMGGYVALALAELFPDRVDGLILLNSTTKADSPQRIENRKRALELMERDPGKFIRLTIPALFAPWSRQRFSAQVQKLQQEALDFPTAGIRAAIRGMMQRPDRTGLMRDLTSPKLVVFGKDDPLIPQKASESVVLETRSKGLMLDGGHMLHLENKEEIVKIVHFID